MEQAQHTAFNGSRRIATGDVIEVALAAKTALDHAKVFVNGGQRGVQVELSPQDLVRTLHARTALVAV